MALTYAQLKNALDELTPEQLAMQASLAVMDMDTPGEVKLLNIHDTALPDDKQFTNADVDLSEFDVEPNLPLLVVWE